MDSMENEQVGQPITPEREVSPAEVVKQAVNLHYDNLTRPHATEEEVKRLATERAERLRILEALPTELVSTVMQPPSMEQLIELKKQEAMLDFGKDVSDTLGEFSDGRLRLFRGETHYVVDGGQKFGTSDGGNRGAPPDFMIANALGNGNCKVEMGKDFQSPKVIVPIQK